jgi:hypothetical protein
MSGVRSSSPALDNPRVMETTAPAFRGCLFPHVGSDVVALPRTSAAREVPTDASCAACRIPVRKLCLHLLHNLVPQASAELRRTLHSNRHSLQAQNADHLARHEHLGTAWKAEHVEPSPSCGVNAQPIRVGEVGVCLPPIRKGAQDIDSCVRVGRLSPDCRAEPTIITPPNLFISLIVDHGWVQFVATKGVRSQDPCDAGTYNA